MASPKKVAASSQEPAPEKKTPEKPSQSISLTDLRPATGATRVKLRVGRGRASGAGKTCNRGHNGEGQRSGRSQKRGFEGGQMPGYRKLPKINGFMLVNQRTWLELNLSQLDDVLGPDETVLTYELLRTRGIMKAKHDGLRLLGGGELKRKLTLEAHHATASALEKIKAAGGKITLLANADEAVAS